MCVCVCVLSVWKCLGVYHWWFPAFIARDVSLCWAVGAHSRCCMVCVGVCWCSLMITLLYEVCVGVCWCSLTLTLLYEVCVGV